MSGELNKYGETIISDEKGFQIVEKNGRRFVRAPAAAAMIPVTEENKIRLIKEEREPGVYSYFISAGQMNEDEIELIETAAREHHEETGYVARKIIPFENNTNSTSKIFKQEKRAFIGTDLWKKPQETGAESENISVYDVTRNELLDLLDDDAFPLEIAGLLYRFARLYNFQENRIDTSKKTQQKLSIPGTVPGTILKNDLK